MIEYVDPSDSKKRVRVELHSGKNRIVRRMFESLGIEVLKLDRTSFAGLTKGMVTRGKWRFLEAKEVLKKSGNSLEYTSHVTGEVIKMFRKPWNANKDGALDLVMTEWDDIAVDKAADELNNQANDQVLEDNESYENE